MAFTIPEDLAPELYPLSWLLGSWRGAGTIDYPGIRPRTMLQEVTFAHDGGPYLSYTSTLREVAGTGNPALDLRDINAAGIKQLEAGDIWSTESGFWRVSPNSSSAGDPKAQVFDIEVMLTDPSGHLSLYLGQAGNGRIDLASDFIARTGTAAEISGATRLYGLVAGDLFWAWDMAAFGNPMGNYFAAKLFRVEADD